MDLIIRGFCCLRPGVPGRTENIRVRSIIGRFLEHSRIFHFAAGQENPLDGEFYIGSADWMYRNLSKRVEVVTPVTSQASEREAVGDSGHLLKDRRQAWVLGQRWKLFAPDSRAVDPTNGPAWVRTNPL